MDHLSRSTLKSFQKHTGMDLNSVSLFGLDPIMHFVDPGNDNFLLKPNSPGWRMGTEIPNDLAEAAGIGLIRRPNIGLLFDP